MKDKSRLSAPPAARVGTWAVAAALAFPAASARARDVFLNGVDISSARGQTLEGVTVRIDALGNVFIDAPQYQVNEENTFLPLSRWNTPPAGTPAHKAPGNVAADMGQARDAKPLPKGDNPLAKAKTPAAGAATPEIPKEGTPAGPALQEKEGDKSGN